MLDRDIQTNGCEKCCLEVKQMDYVCRTVAYSSVRRHSLILMYNNLQNTIMYHMDKRVKLWKWFLLMWGILYCMNARSCWLQTLEALAWNQENTSEECISWVCCASHYENVVVELGRVFLWISSLQKLFHGTNIRKIIEDIPCQWQKTIFESCELAHTSDCSQEWSGAWGKDCTSCEVNGAIC